MAARDEQSSYRSRPLIQMAKLTVERAMQLLVQGSADGLIRARGCAAGEAKASIGGSNTPTFDGTLNGGGLFRSLRSEQS